MSAKWQSDVFTRLFLARNHAMSGRSHTPITASGYDSQATENSACKRGGSPARKPA